MCLNTSIDRPEGDAGLPTRMNSVGAATRCKRRLRFGLCIHGSQANSASVSRALLKTDRCSFRSSGGVGAKLAGNQILCQTGHDHRRPGARNSDAAEAIFGASGPMED